MRHPDRAMKITPVSPHAPGEPGGGDAGLMSGHPGAARHLLPGRLPVLPGALLQGLGRLLAMVVTLILLNGCSGLSQVDTGKGAGEVIVYTRAGCPYCAMAKKYLADHNIAYQEYDIFKSEKGSRDFKSLGGIGVPIFIVGNKRMDGYDEGRLSALLKSEGILKK
jgi:glutaredoxin